MRLHLNFKLLLFGSVLLVSSRLEGQVTPQASTQDLSPSQVQPFEGDGPNKSVRIYIDPRTHSTYAEYLYFYFPDASRPEFRQTDVAHSVIISRVDDAQEFNKWMDNPDIMAVCFQYYSPQARATIQLGALPGVKQALAFQGVLQVIQKFMEVAAKGHALGVKDGTKKIYSNIESPDGNYMIVHWDASGKCYLQDGIAYAWKDDVVHFSEDDAPALLHAVQDSADLFQKVIVLPNQGLQAKERDKAKLLNQIK
jgi:hypothetical protein